MHIISHNLCEKLRILVQSFQMIGKFAAYAAFVQVSAVVLPALTDYSSLIVMRNSYHTKFSAIVMVKSFSQRSCRIRAAAYVMSSTSRSSSSIFSHSYRNYIFKPKFYHILQHCFIFIRGNHSFLNSVWGQSDFFRIFMMLRSFNFRLGIYFCSQRTPKNQKQWSDLT